MRGWIEQSCVFRDLAGIRTGVRMTPALVSAMLSRPVRCRQVGLIPDIAAG